MLGKVYGITFLALAVTAPPVRAQTGLYPYGSFDTVGVDTIDRGSLNVHIEIPVVAKQGRGVPFQYTLVYDGLVWTPVGSAGSQTWTPAVGFGLHGQFNEGYEGYISYASAVVRCTANGTVTFVPYDIGYAYHDQFGVTHPLPYTFNACGSITTGASTPASDGSGYVYNGVNLVARDGRAIHAPLNSQSASGSLTDSNGNSVTNNGDGTFTDTLGKTALTIAGSGTPSSPKTFAYSTPTGTQKVMVTYTAYTVQTAFGCSGVTEYNLAQDLPNTITLADGSVYTFKYEKTPGGTTQVTGRLASVTLPQGGTVNYTYTGANNGIVCADGTPAGLNRSGGVGRVYARSAITPSSSQTTVTDGLSNTSIYNFVIAGSPEAFYETKRSVYQGSTSGSLLLSRQTCYNQAANPCTTTAIALPITQIDTYEALNGGLQHGSALAYNSYGLQTSRTDYDFSAGSTHGPTLRTETWTYPSTGIVSLVSTDTVTDGSNNQIGLSTYSYDETSGTGHAALVTISGLPQHVSGTWQRGNLTTVNQSFNPGSHLTTAAAYEDTGNALNVTGPTGVSTYAYDPATHAFTVTATPPTPSSGVSLPSSATYDSNSSMPLTAVDPNNQSVTYASYDPRLRPTQINYPDGGKMVASYTPNSTGVYHYMTSTTHTNTQTSFDSYGRLNWVAVENSSGGYYWNNYCYDGNSNLQFAAYTFSSGTIVCSGAGDTYTYDALGRVLTTTHADSSVITYAYNGRATQVTDESGVSRVVQVDGLGRPTAVCEISSSMLFGAGQTGTPANCSMDITTASGFKTTYAYATDTTRSNALETTVTQGQQTRTFETDWLGRTTSVVQPESGATTYSYAYSTGSGLGLTVTRVRPQANQTGSATTTTTTQYDSVGRMVSVNYSDGTPSKGFAYDTNIYWTQVGTNLKGRLAATGGGTGATWNGSSIGYDTMGRVVNIWACGPATCGTSYQASRPLSFAYDWAGNLTQETDVPSGTIAYGRSIAGEVTSITNDSYQNLPYNPPNLISNVVNGPDGPVSYTLGNGLNVYRSYDTLGRAAQIWVCNGPAAHNCSGGTALYGTASQWNGSQMQFQSDTVLNQQVTFGYGDGFNRLTSRTVTSGTVQNYTYTYDRYGNRVSQTALQTGYNFNPTINPVNNQITTSGYTYDAAGNMTNDTVHSYTYDAEGNITKVDVGSTAQYVYDVFNRRIHVQTASGTTEYIYDYAGRRISSWLSPNNYGNEGRIYWDGQQIAYRSTDGTTYFDHQDTLGTERMRTNYAKSVGSSYISLPWGDGYTATVNNSGADQDNAHFAGLERDSESGTEHAQFRNYASVQGRWLAPDSYMGSYDLTNPQSMNRYAYSLNNPASFIDPSGLDNTSSCADGDSEDDADEQSCAVGGGTGSNGAPSGGAPFTFQVFAFDWVGYWQWFYSFATYPGFNTFTGLGSTAPQIGHGGAAPNNPTTPTPVCYQGGCILPGGPPLITKQQIKQAAKTYLCGSSPADNVKNWTAEGTVKGLVFGGAAGGITGTVVGTPVGGAIGAVAGGVIDGAIGGATGVIWGSIASWACYAAGAY